MKRKWIVALIGITTILTPILFFTFLVWIPQSGMQNRAPIVIIGDYAFTSENGVNRGSGTPEDPYIVENWRIEGAGEQNCILIINTTVWFTIHNCILLNHMKNLHFYQGIYFGNVTNGHINQCQVYTVLLEDSNSNIIENNQVTSGDFWGIQIDSSNNNQILENTFTEYLLKSIFIYGENNSISQNTCTNRGDVGIYVFGWNNTVVQNICSNKNSAGIRIDGSENLIVNNTCSYNDGDGIQLFLAYNNSVVGNTFAYNRKYGIELDKLSTENYIAHNNLFMNWLQGIQEEGMVGNDIHENVEVDNFGWLFMLFFLIGIIAFSLFSPKLLVIKQRNIKSRITQDFIFECILTGIALFAILAYTVFYLDLIGIIEGLIFGIWGLTLCIRTWMGKGSIFHPPTHISLILTWILPILGIFIFYASVAMFAWMCELISFAVYDTILYRQKLNLERKQKAPV